MLKRLKDVAIAAVFGAGVLAFCIAVWSASSCDPREIAQRPAAYQKAHKETCDAFKISPFKGVGIFLANNVIEISTVVGGVATSFIAAFTILLAGISRRALMATHRPKVGIRRLELNLAWPEDGRAEANFFLVNKGASDAAIVRANGILYFRSPDSGHGFRYTFDDYAGEIEGSPARLPGGASVKVKIRSADTKATANSRLNGKWFIYAAGRIVYKDETGTERATAFLREWRSGTDWFFRPVGDPEYEYED